LSAEEEAEVALEEVSPLAEDEGVDSAVVEI